MTSSMITTTIVQPGHKIEIPVPDLREGEEVRVIVYRTQPDPNVPRQSIFDIIESLNGHRLFQSPEEVDRYINEERDSWDR